MTPLAPRNESSGDGSRSKGVSPNVGRIVLSNRVFFGCMIVIGGTYVLLILSMLLADASYVVEKTSVAASESAEP